MVPTFHQRRIFIEVARSFLHTPYRWAGDDPTGIDCSGLVIECLKSIGRLSEQVDMTANGLWEKFRKYEIKHPSDGDILFWQNKTGRMIHVAIAIDQHFCITASGGGSDTKDLEDAVEQNAFVKVRPQEYRKGEPVRINIFREI